MRPALGELDRGLLREAPAILGIDEVGRGALAGPVVVAGAVFGTIPDTPLIQDSKQLTRLQRERAARWVRKNALRWGIVEIGVETIDRTDILRAVRMAMTALVRELASEETAVVCDAVRPSDPSLDVLAPAKADESWFCVAAASVLAKVHRDAVLAELSDRWPGWGWETNAGYGTRHHRAELDRRGRSILHRTTFRWGPVLP